MSFADLLKKPLPSASSKVVTEGVDDLNPGEVDPDTIVTPPTPEDAIVPAEPFKATECDDGEECDVPDPTPVVTPVPDVVPEVDAAPLTPDESQRVDDTMNVVATPMLIASELDESALDEFVESTDADIAVAEGFLTEKTIVRFDKNAKKAQLYEVAVAAVAREKNDPLYRKLQTVYKMERILKAKLRKKYNSQASKKVKEYLARAKKSKSGVLARIAAKLSGK